jgi:hypothetical protein
MKNYFKGLVVGGLLSFGLALCGVENKGVTSKPLASTSNLPPLTLADKASPTPATPPPYVRPTVADNGSPFPAQSGYIAKYPQRFTDGYSSVTIDNSGNDSDLLIKLVSLDSKPSVVASVLLVKAKDTFTVQEVRAGQYEVLYQNLDSGALARTESFTLKENQVAGGTEFSKLTLTLYNVTNGNMQTYPISADDFKL